MSVSKKIPLKNFDKLVLVCKRKFELKRTSTDRKVLIFKTKANIKMKGFKGPDYSSKVAIKITLKAHKRIAEIQLTRVNTELIIVCLLIASIISVFSIYIEFYTGIFLGIITSFLIFVKTLNDSTRGMEKFLNNLMSEISI